MRDAFLIVAAFQMAVAALLFTPPAVTVMLRLSRQLAARTRG